MDVDVARKYVREVSARVGFLFILVENASDDDLDNVLLGYRQAATGMPCGSGPKRRPAIVEKALSGAAEQTTIMPFLKSRESLLWLLGVYIQDQNGFPHEYVADVVRPTRISYRVRQTGEQRSLDVRLPLLDRAAKIPIPFGWYMQ